MMSGKMGLIVSVSFFMLASICNSIMDVTSHHFSLSIFKNLNPMWWNGEISWKNKYVNGDPTKGRKKLWGNINYPVQLTDCWHFFKMLMIIFLTVSVVTFDSTIINHPYQYLLYICLYGFFWNTTFSLFYNKIFKLK
jgi:hypothetical protein